MSEVIRIPIRRGRAALIGCVYAGFGASIAAPCLIVILNEGLRSEMFFLALLGLGLLAVGVWHIGVAITAPVALRMDKDGISGYFIPPATWGEIADIGRHEVENKKYFIGFKLIDPMEFRDRQTPWQRLKSHLNRRATGFDLLLPGTMLKDVDVKATVSAAHRLAKQCQPRSNSHNDVT